MRTDLRLCDLSFIDRQKFKWRVNTDTRLNAGAKLVLDNLIMHVNCKYEECYPGQALICQETALTENTVRAAVRSLRDCGWITWRVASNGGYIYRIIWDANPEIRLGRSVPQTIEAPSKSEGVEPQPSPSKSAGDDPQNLRAKVRRGITNRSSLSSASPTRESAASSEKPSSSAETNSHKKLRAGERIGATAETNPNPKHSPQWWDWKLWYETAPRFKAMFYPTISKSAFGKRLGEIKRRQANDIRAVDQALLDAIKAEPGGDAWEYVCGILRGANTPKGRPVDELDAEFRPRAPVDRYIM